MAFADAWLGWKNWANNINTTITAATTQAGYYANSLKNWLPWDFWQGNSGSGNIDFDCFYVLNVNYLALAAHTFGTNTATLEFYGATDSSFTGAELIFSQAVSPSTANPVLCFKFDTKTYRYYRLRYTGADDAVRLGVIAFGLRTEFEIGFYGGFPTPKWNDDAEVTNSRSEGGVFLGRSVLRTGIKPVSLTIEPVTHAWVNNEFLPFKEHATSYPFFLAWGSTYNENNVFAIQNVWAQAKLKNRVHATVGLTFEGVTK